MAVIIWINGTFGSGKTSVAYELHRRIENSFVYDPEEVGFFISQNVPSTAGATDFQDIALWRQFNGAMIKHISDHYDGIILIPMTVVDKGYYDEIKNHIDRCNQPYYHFTLMATEANIRKRLRKRLDFGNGWCSKQMSRCMPLLEEDHFKEHIITDGVSVPELAEQIADRCGIILDKGRLSLLGYFIHRLKVIRKVYRG